MPSWFSLTKHSLIVETCARHRDIINFLRGGVASSGKYSCFIFGGGLCFVGRERNFLVEREKNGACFRGMRDTRGYGAPREEACMLNIDLPLGVFFIIMSESRGNVKAKETYSVYIGIKTASYIEDPAPYFPRTGGSEEFRKGRDFPDYPN